MNEIVRRMILRRRRDRKKERSLSHRGNHLLRIEEIRNCLFSRLLIGSNALYTLNFRDSSRKRENSGARTHDWRVQCPRSCSSGGCTNWLVHVTRKDVTHMEEEGADRETSGRPQITRVGISRENSHVRRPVDCCDTIEIRLDSFTSDDNTAVLFGAISHACI